MHFSREPAATAKNDQLLSDHGFDLDSLLSDSQDTTLGYCPEFRPIDQLQIVLGGTPEIPSQIPPSSPIHGESTANNFLEFLGMVVNVWLMCETFTEKSESLLAIGDNTSAIG
jgi:hypothetical protein